jgi:hypothetical protein
LAGNCYQCHNSKLKAGGLNLQAYTSSDAVSENREQWEKVLGKLRSGEMPPKGTPRPIEAERKRVESWIENEFQRSAKPNPGRVTARRLNRAEFNNTVRDLLGVDTQPADDFPQDDSVYGFDNIAEALSVSPLLMEKYLAVAERVAQTAVFGPKLKTLTTRFEIPIPRRMEVANNRRPAQPAYYSLNDYDVTGLSHPGSLHMTYRFPTDGEYVFQIVGAGFRPAGSEPGQCNLWIDGTVVKTFEVPEVEQSGLDRRPDEWVVRLQVGAGQHEIEAAFPRQFEGLPPKYGGPNPSHRPTPELRDPSTVPLPPNATPGKIEERRIAIERFKAQSLHPVFDGLAVMAFNIVGPYGYKTGPSPESLRKIYACGHLNGVHQRGCDRRILSRLAGRAFRRAVTAGEIDGLLAIAGGARRRGSSFEEGIALAIEAMLVSPDFIFRLETGVSTRNAGAPYPLSQYELASRLSYFLWSSMPDDELLACARQGTLRKPQTLEAQVRRMLKDPRSRALVDNFASEWLETRRLESAQPDRDRFPDFDEYLRQSMRKETGLFFLNLIQEDRSILDLIDGQYTFLNERLARHYGIRGVTGTAFRKADLSGTGRGGIVTQASVLTVSSYATRTSPVLRGKWILENLLNAPPPPPPPDVPNLNEDTVGSSASLRRQMEQHRENAVCASCHARMDPLGFALENYDAVGAWRDLDAGFPIDPSGVLPDGRTFQGAKGLKSILDKDRDAFAKCMTEKLLIYALGRGLERYDQPAVRQIVSRGAAADYRFSAFILGIVNSVPFQMQRGEGGKT